MTVQVHDSMLVTGPTTVEPPILTPTTGTTVALTPISPIAFAAVTPAGPLAALTLTIANGTIPGQVQTVLFTQSITALTCSGANLSGSILALPVFARANTALKFIWSAVNGYWILTDIANAVGFQSTTTSWQYKANTGATSGYPGDGSLLWDNATQTSAAHLILAHITTDNFDIDLLLAQVGNTQTLILQDANNSANYQKWSVTGSGVNTNTGTSTSYWTFPVTLAASGGTGATGFANNHQLVAFWIV